MKQFILTVFAVLFISNLSQAGFLIEPKVGYNFGTYSLNASQAGLTATFNAPATGMGFGGLLGVTFAEILFAGVDYQSNTYNFNSYSSGGNSLVSSTGTQNMVSIEGGVNLMMFSAYVGYVVSNQQSQVFTGQTYNWTGNGFRVGVGYKLLPILKLNVEYFATKNTSVSPQVVAGVTYNELDVNSVFTYLSVPLSF